MAQSPSHAEQIRRRPGMYLGGVDEVALHSMAEGVLANAVEEAMAGHATAIDIVLKGDGSLTIADNGRGIPVDIHPKYQQPALEVVFTHLVFTPAKNIVLRPSNDLRSVSLCIVNALSDRLWVEVVREKRLYHLAFAAGAPSGGLQFKGTAEDRRGTTVCLHPDPEIFGDLRFNPLKLYLIAQRQARRCGDTQISWKYDRELYDGHTPIVDKIHFPNRT